MFAQLSWNLWAFHCNRTTCEAPHCPLHPPFIPGMSTAKQKCSPAWNHPVDALWQLAEIPAQLGDPGWCSLCCSESNAFTWEHLWVQPLCLLEATLGSSSCRTHWIPIYTLVHSSAALLAIPCCFLINSGTEWCSSISKGQPLQIRGNPTKYKLGKSTVSAGVPAKSPVLDLQQSKHHINQRNTWNNPFSVVLH